MIDYMWLASSFVLKGAKSQKPHVHENKTTKTQTQSSSMSPLIAHSVWVSGEQISFFFFYCRVPGQERVAGTETDHEKMRRECQSLISVFQHHILHLKDPGLLQLS